MRYREVHWTYYPKRKDPIAAKVATKKLKNAPIVKLVIRSVEPGPTAQHKFAAEERGRPGEAQDQVLSHLYVHAYTVARWSANQVWITGEHPHGDPINRGSS
jgi:hypothetical protein